QLFGQKANSITKELQKSRWDGKHGNNSTSCCPQAINEQTHKVQDEGHNPSEKQRRTDQRKQPENHKRKSKQRREPMYHLYFLRVRFPDQGTALTKIENLAKECPRPGASLVIDECIRY